MWCPLPYIYICCGGRGQSELDLSSCLRSRHD
uniref:Uncharacterized protein n=1 Tax=Arundo donax TaxID=35708 RepID=A0A0A9BUW0_ARUDO